MKLVRICIGMLILVLLVTGCTKSAVENNKEVPVVIESLQPSTPLSEETESSKETIPPSKFDQLHTYIQDKEQQIRSVIVSRDEDIIFEEYYGDATESTLNHVRSVTKSVLSALIGIAIEEGFIKDIDQKVEEFFPEYMTKETHPQVDEITIKHLLTMTSGIPYNYMNYSSWISADNPIETTLALDLITDPGADFYYNDPGVHILSGIISKTTGMKASDFAEKYLFDELGIHSYEWPTDLQGNNFGPAELELTARDMLKFGQLYLNKGKWNGKTVVPAGWVDESVTAHTDGGLPSGGKYGYLWWVTQVNDYTSYYAMGYGGQFIYIIPELDLVTVITSGLDRHYEGNKMLVEQFVIPAIINTK
ncbi:serine hydrolase [Paenibacillus sp. GSMTC-2017]|uniref:serine hydrolase domain-containing protein n=1 Tax=Paenibacillus sp. GSMTC-2017 TaxID=2794350 RepID=UPI0018D5F176|nr:serine hydrolase [Paenibacillus sp. GSMTC-2017]MBH5316912.1 serine hydrolase [Paenibacillus sp. GSMTC-2017]